MSAETEAITKRKAVSQNFTETFELADDRDIALCLTMNDCSQYQELEPFEILSYCNNSCM
jgi:hypothetical protein